MARKKKTERKRNIAYEKATFSCDTISDDCSAAENSDKSGYETVAQYARPDEPDKPKSAWLRKVADRSKLSSEAFETSRRCIFSHLRRCCSGSWTRQIYLCHCFATSRFMEHSHVVVWWWCDGDGTDTKPAAIACSDIQISVKNKGGRPRTRSLTCDICFKTYAHQASIVRHRRISQGLDANDEPVRNLAENALKPSSVASASSPLRRSLFLRWKTATAAGR